MSDLGKRLDDLAGRATAGTTLLDPSRRAVTTERPLRRRSLVIAVAALVAVVASLAVWQGRDGSTTSVIAAEGDGDDTTVPLTFDSCDLEASLPVLRSGLPTYDYEPAGSYAALAEQSAVVVTGRVVSAVRTEVSGRSYTELTLTEVVELQDGFWSRTEVDVIAYDAVWANRSQPDPLASPIEFQDLTFVGFLSPWSGVRGGWAPGPEGLYVGCGDQPLEAVFNDAAGPDDPTNANRSAMSEALLAEEQALGGADENAADAAGQAADREAAQAAADAARVAAENARRIDQERIAALGIDAPATIAEARALWEATAISEYRLRYVELRAEGAMSGVTMRVDNGIVIDAVFVRGLDDGAVLAVDDLFDLAESADIVREISFDRTRGFPTVLSLDPDFDLPGDEFSIREITLDSKAELEAIDARITAWLPPAIDPPGGVEAFSGPQASNVSHVYLLHEEPELDAFAYLANDDVCVAVVLKGGDQGATEYSDESAGTCMPATDFDTRPLVLAITATSGPDYMIVVQSLDAFDHVWSAEAEAEAEAEADGGRLDVTTRSAFLIVTDEVPASLARVLLEIACPCGDATYLLPPG